MHASTIRLSRSLHTSGGRGKELPARERWRRACSALKPAGRSTSALKDRSRRCRPAMAASVLGSRADSWHARSANACDAHGSSSGYP